MNRRELFKGMAAAFAAASIPLPFSEPLDDLYGVSPAVQALGMVKYLNRVKADLIHRITNPPALLDGNTIRSLPTTNDQVALQYVIKFLEELNG